MINVLIPLMIILESADGIFTYSVVSNDLAREGNPLLQNIAGTGSFLLVKIAGALLSALMLWLAYKRYPRVSLIATSGIVMLYTLVLIWNLTTLF